MNMPELLRDIKIYLNITYEDPVADELLLDSIGDGMARIDDYAGRKQDYQEAGLARSLLKDYCRYARSHATEMFSINYRRELNNLREQSEIESYKESNEHEG